MVEISTYLPTKQILNQTESLKHQYYFNVEFQKQINTRSFCHFRRLNLEL